MKQTMLLFASVLTALAMHAQTGENDSTQAAYRPMIEDGKVWVVSVAADSRETEGDIVYYLEGDTVVDGHSAQRMLCLRTSAGADSSGEYVGAWYEQSRKVYYAPKGQSFSLLYDFSLTQGDSIASPKGGMLPVEKRTGGIEGFKGTYYDIGEDRWLEGVGSTYEPWLSLHWNGSGNEGTLLRCSVGDEVIYSNPTAVTSTSGAPSHRFEFTHTRKNKPKAPVLRAADTPLYGDYTNEQLGIRLDRLEDTYLVVITNDTRNIVYQKTANATNIVALDIDISDYPGGLYTVTLENSMETFTGMLEIQTTGIESVGNRQKTVNRRLYNLHGQCIQSPQKGVNITNGKKFYVK